MEPSGVWVCIKSFDILTQFILWFSINRVLSKNSHRREMLWISKLKDKSSLTFIPLINHRGENFDWKWLKSRMIKISSEAFSTSQVSIRVLIWMNFQGITRLNLCHKLMFSPLPGQLTSHTFLWELDHWDSCLIPLPLIAFGSQYLKKQCGIKHLLFL